MFKRRWDVFKDGSQLSPESVSAQLFQCAGNALGDNLLKMDQDITSKAPAVVLDAMRTLAVIPVATGVLRAELTQMQQGRDEPVRSFAARVRGKAETCSYTTKCHGCDADVDFTNHMIRDVLIAGISDLDIRREILGADSILTRAVNDVVSLVESKEMARNALPTAASTSGISSFKREKNTPAKPPPTSQRSETAPCPECKKLYSLYSEGAKGWNTRPHRLCIDCYRTQRRRQRNYKAPAASEVGSIVSQVTSLTGAADDQMKHPLARRKAHRGATQRGVTSQGPWPSTTRLPHHIFTKGEWRKVKALSHPEVKLTLSVDSSDYRSFGRQCPKILPSTITALADSGAQSCLWSMEGFLAMGFSMKDLIPVSLDLSAANKSPINIAGAVLARLHGKSTRGTPLSCATMVYVSNSCQGFYLSWEAMVDLGIVSSSFPSVGDESAACELHEARPEIARPSTHKNIRALNAGCASARTDQDSPCSCPPRSVVPVDPPTLPFECIPENKQKMKDWLLDHFASSTFNTCPHRPLPCMAGPPVEIHLNDDATPKSVHTPASLPLHWQKQVHNDLLRDEVLGVIEKVPYGEPVTWCHRMVVTRKHDGTPRRTVDLSPLNKHCKRETFASESPFHLARRIPKDSWKTVTDAWNGYHSVPLRKSDRHLTTFITPFGRWRYTRAPQGFLSSGDGYNRRFDAILTDFDRKERCVDDTIH